MTLVKFNPVRDLIDFEREFNKMFNSIENRFGIPNSIAQECLKGFKMKGDAWN